MRTETKVLIAMRKEFGGTQREMAEVFNYSTSQFVSNWERSKCGFPAEHLKTVTKYFGKVWAEKIIRAKVKDFEQQLREM